MLVTGDQSEQELKVLPSIVESTACTCADSRRTVPGQMAEEYVPTATAVHQPATSYRHTAEEPVTKQQHISPFLAESI